MAKARVFEWQGKYRITTYQHRVVSVAAITCGEHALSLGMVVYQEDEDGETERGVVYEIQLRRGDGPMAAISWTMSGKRSWITLDQYQCSDSGCIPCNVREFETSRPINQHAH